MYLKLAALALAATPVHSFMPSPHFGVQRRTMPLFSTAADEFMRKSADMAEIQASEEEVPKLFNEDLLEDMRSCLLALEKRVSEGPGCMTNAEVDDFAVAAGRVLMDMKEQGAALDKRVKPGERQAKAEKIAADAAIQAEKEGRTPEEIEAIAKMAFDNAIAAMIPPPPGAEPGPQAPPARPAAPAGPTPLVTEIGDNASQVPFSNLAELAARTREMAPPSTAPSTMGDSSRSSQLPSSMAPPPPKMGDSSRSAPPPSSMAPPRSSMIGNTSPDSMNLSPTSPMGNMQSLAPPSPINSMRSTQVAVPPPTPPVGNNSMESSNKAPLSPTQMNNPMHRSSSIPQVRPPPTMNRPTAIPPSPTMDRSTSIPQAPPSPTMDSSTSIPQAPPSPTMDSSTSIPQVPPPAAAAPPPQTGKYENLNDEPDFDGKSIGLSKGTANTYAIPGMEEMTPDEYQKALADSVIERSRNQRFNGKTRGNSLTHDYMAHLSGGKDVNVFSKNKDVDETV